MAASEASAGKKKTSKSKKDKAAAGEGGGLVCFFVCSWAENNLKFVFKFFAVK
jgi:hypothetical protein